MWYCEFWTPALALRLLQLFNLYPECTDGELSRVNLQLLIVQFAFQGIDDFSVAACPKSVCSAASTIASERATISSPRHLLAGHGRLCGNLVQVIDHQLAQQFRRMLVVTETATASRCLGEERVRSAHNRRLLQLCTLRQVARRYGITALSLGSTHTLLHLRKHLVAALDGLVPRGLQSSRSCSSDSSCNWNNSRQEMTTLSATTAAHFPE